jgi:hypothetical protein
MADGLADLGSPVEDRILVLNILRGLNQRFEHVGSIIQRYSPFPNFLKVWDDLVLEEIHVDSTGPSAAPTVLYTNGAPPTARPPSSTPSRPPSGGNGGYRNKNNNKNCNGGHGGGNNGRNSNGSGSRNNSSGQTTAPTASDGRTGTPWSSYGHPWQGHMTIYPARCPQESNVRRPSWPRRAPIRHPGSYLASSSSSRSTNRLLSLPHQAGTPRSAQAGTSNRWPTPSTPWRSTHLRLRSKTGWPAPARCTTPLHQLIISPPLVF